MVNKVKIFSCGFCKDKGIDTSLSRSGLREHLKENHIRNKELFNSSNPQIDSRGMPYHKQDWVITKEING